MKLLALSLLLVLTFVASVIPQEPNVATTLGERTRRTRGSGVGVAGVPAPRLREGFGGEAPKEVEVKTFLDRTAVWVADPVTYSITLVCAKGVDILADDLSKDKLHAEGLEVLDSQSTRATGGDDADRTTYTFSYDLATYRVDLPELTIAPLSVRYYIKRPGQRIGDAAPAGEVQVPAAVIAFRSALPDGQETYAIRDSRGIRRRRLRYAWLQPIGIGLVLISIVPAALAVVAAARRAAPRERPRSARQVRQDEQAALEAVQALDISTLAGRREAYARVNALIRDHVSHAAGLEAAALTPVEIGARHPHELISAVLVACDQARYAPPDTLPPVDACRATIEQAAQVLAG